MSEENSTNQVSEGVEESMEEEESEVSRVLESLGACALAEEFGRQFDDPEEAYDALDMDNSRHRSWWFWIVSELCARMQRKELLRDITNSLDIVNDGADVTDAVVSYKCGYLIGLLEASESVTKKIDETFYGLNSHFGEEIASVVDRYRGDLLTLWEDYKREKQL